MRRSAERRPLGRSWHRWEDNIKKDFKKLDGEAWTELFCQDSDRWGAVVNAVINLRVP